MRLAKIFGLLLVPASVAMAQTGDPGVMPSYFGVIVLDIFTMAFLFFASLWGFELYRMMKGGQLATSWGLVTAAVIFYTLGTLISFGASANFWDHSPMLDSAINLLVGITLFLGVYQQRKVLS